MAAMKLVAAQVAGSRQVVGLFEQPSYFRGGGRSGAVDGQPAQRTVDGVRDHRIQRIRTRRIGVHVGVGITRRPTNMSDELLLACGHVDAEDARTLQA